MYTSRNKFPQISDVIFEVFEIFSVSFQTNCSRSVPEKLIIRKQLMALLPVDMLNILVSTSANPSSIYNNSSSTSKLESLEIKGNPK